MEDGVFITVADEGSVDVRLDVAADDDIFLLTTHELTS